MDNKQSKPIQTKANPTLIGTIFFTVVNFILLSILSWIMLEVWFCVQTMYSGLNKINLIVHEMLTNNIDKIVSLHSEYSDMSLSVINKTQNYLQTWCYPYLNHNFAQVLIGVTSLTLTRLCIFTSYMPLLAMTLSVFVVDGLVQRDKRKFQGSRESAFLFHRIKPLTRLSFFILFFIYMSLPYPTLPELLLIPMIVLTSLFTLFSIKNFKKYL